MYLILAVLMTQGDSPEFLINKRIYEIEIGETAYIPAENLQVNKDSLFLVPLQYTCPAPIFPEGSCKIERRKDGYHVTIFLFRDGKSPMFSKSSRLESKWFGPHLIIIKSITLVRSKLWTRSWSFGCFVF